MAIFGWICLIIIGLACIAGLLLWFLAANLKEMP